MDALESSQETAMANEDYQPGAGGPFNLPDGPNYTWCNQATFDINTDTNVSIDGMTSPESRWDTSANEAAERISTNPRYKKLTASEAQTLANRGFTVTGVWKNQGSGSGHLVTIRADFNRFDSKKGPLTANIGVDNAVKYAVEAFGANRLGKVEYYYDPKQFEPE